MDLECTGNVNTAWYKNILHPEEHSRSDGINFTKRHMSFCDFWFYVQ